MRVTAIAFLGFDVGSFLGCPVSNCSGRDSCAFNWLGRPIIESWSALNPVNDQWFVGNFTKFFPASYFEDERGSSKVKNEHRKKYRKLAF